MRTLNQTTETVPIDALKAHPRNPRQGDIGAIHESIQVNGFYGFVIAQRSTGYILAGNHRWKAAQQAGAKTIPVTWIDVEDDHALRILLADNRTNDLATYDDNALAQLLQDLQNTTGSLAGTGYDGDDLDDLLKDLNDALITPQENRKIESPVYEPTGPCPPLQELTNTTKTDMLLAEIEEANVPEDVKSFLRLAAHRHTVFDYENVAEYYAHAPAPIQRLMERSALIIIDFDQAVELGHVKLVGEVAKLYAQDYGEDEDA